MADPKDKSLLEKAEDAVSDSYDQQRKAIPAWDGVGRVKHDVEVGLMKAAYGGVKSLLSGAIDLARLGMDPVAIVQFGIKAWPVAVKLAKEERIAHFGTPAEKQDQNERTIAFAKEVYASFEKDWKEAEAKDDAFTELDGKKSYGQSYGKRTELASKWVGRVGFEVGALAVGAGEAKAAIKGGEIVGDLGKLEEGGAILDGVTQPCKTMVMSNEAILAEIEPKMAASAKAADEAAAAANAAKAAKAAQDAKEAAAAAKAAEAAKLARQRLVDRAGPLQKPWHIREGEGVLPKTAKTAAPGKPMVLDPNVSNRYMYVVKENGDIVYAPQKMKGTVETVKHTDLAENGQARVSGELNYDKSTGKWVMDDASGRYSAWRASPDSPLVGTRTPENLEAAAELARQSGTSAKIVVAK